MAKAEAYLGGEGYQAFLFDMDGVLTDTAALHRAAWRRVFDEVLREAGGAAFTDADYRQFVDGRSRLDGVRTFLGARGIVLPPGTPDDQPDARTMHGLAARKDALFRETLATQPVQAYPGTVGLLRQLRAGGVPVAVVTASRNAAQVLTAAGVTDLVDVLVDGVEAARSRLAGKPDPALFLRAAELLGVDPANAIVVEDALAGVAAGRAGGFGLVVGVDRTGEPGAFTAAGADVVVSDVGELTVTTTDPACVLCASPDGEWTLHFVGADPQLEGTREALLTLGNGYLATRGCAAEAVADATHYPGTYVAGVYNRLKSTVDGVEREDESIVNLPNWLPLSFRPQGGSWFGADDVEVLHEHRVLSLRRGVLLRETVVRDAEGRQTRVRQRRLVSMAAPHLAAVQLTLTPENWSGRVEVRSGLDGRVRNANVPSFAGLADQHLTGVATTSGDDMLALTAQTSQSLIRIALCARTQVRRDGQSIRAERQVLDDGQSVSEVLTCSVEAGQDVMVDKVAAIHTSRDRGITEPLAAAQGDVAAVGSMDVLAAEHEAAWAHLWSRFRLRMADGSASSVAVNLHLLHLLQTLSPHTMDLDVGVPARGLHGEGYRGHIFWDEIFVLPFLTYRLPELSRSLLLYRYRRLGRARRQAADRGLRGALYPWQSGSSGREETPHSFYNPLSGRWMADNSRLQYHVGLAVAYNVWQYWATTGDLGFLVAYGGEMLVEVARFWASIATYDSTADRYDIRGVMGPDEFHDGYPDRPGSGVDNSAYVNIMTAWVLARALDAYRIIGRDHDALWDRLGLTVDELEHWQRLRSRLRLSFLADGVPSQFEGYPDLAELDWDRYRAEHGDLGRLDLILEAEGDSTNRYQVSKQADVLMLLYLFGAEELTELITGLGYDFDPAVIPCTVEHYLDRTTHGSTLSRVAHAWVLSRTDRRGSWRMLRDALEADLRDTQHGATREGIHLGAIAGTLDILQRCYPGLDNREGTLWLHPALPEELHELEFDLRYRDQGISVALNHAEARLNAAPGAAHPVSINVDGTRHELAAGQDLTIPLSS